ncbi:glycosyltransferase family 2 protein [Massilia sp. UMI-21]|nr:glycosyltransferase family 2 protein [Massilia sp. UMI-21]
MISNRPKVSICVVTYNQERLITQCLQSLVDQEVDFDIEIVVADDCSTDGTRLIVEQFSARYPDLIRPFLHEKNIGAYKNFLFVHEQARGMYIAHMDGDDYALPGKLKAQADFLDANPECNVVFHRVKVLYEGSDCLVDDLTNTALIPSGGYDRSSVLRHISVGANSSKMYRAAMRVREYPSFNIVDYFETVEQVGAGRACYVNDQAYGVYRANVGIASAGGGTRRALCNSFLYFARKYPTERKHVNAAALLLLIADFKNRRPTWREFFAVWVKTFHPMAAVELIRNWPITRMLRLPPPKVTKCSN